MQSDRLTRLGVALEPAQDGVGVAVRSTEGEADEIELLGGNCPHGGAVVGVVAGGNISLV